MKAMKTVEMPELYEVVKSDYNRPAISIVMPFDPKMNLKTGLAQALKIAADKIEDELLHSYSQETCKLMMHKIWNITNTLNYNTYKKSIAIFVSPVFEKVMYLDIPVEERIIIDSSFEIRDILYAKKQMKQYLVLLLSNKQSCIYLARLNKFERIVFNTRQSDYSFMGHVKQKVANFTDTSSHKETLMDKFLLNIDHVLDVIVKAYQLPLFVFGTEKILGHFKHITKHGGQVIEYIEDNYMDAGTAEIKRILQQHVEDWNKIKQKHLLNQLEAAADKGKLVAGIRNVWRQATNHNGKLLLVEKDFAYTAQPGKAGILHKAMDNYSQFSHIKDAVDDVIEKVLEHGGDVEFVDNDLLKSYRRIALIQFN